jgi:hypothetical protein
LGICILPHCVRTEPLRRFAVSTSVGETSSSRLLKNKFREGQAPNILYASLLDYTFGSASLVASVRFSAACWRVAEKLFSEGVIPSEPGSPTSAVVTQVGVAKAGSPTTGAFAVAGAEQRGICLLCA